MVATTLEGIVTAERPRHPGEMLTLAETVADFTKPPHILQQDVQNQRLAVENRERRSIAILLVENQATP